jgi:Flp pilus assembly protein TadD
MLREREKDVPGSITAYRQALDRDGRSVVALNNLAVRLGQDPKTRDEGSALAERAYQLGPRNPAIAETLGWIVFQKGDVDRAQKLLEQAVAGQPDDPIGRYHLAQVYAKRGKKVEARRELEVALKAPAFAEAADARKLLDTLR